MSVALRSRSGQTGPYSLQLSLFGVGGTKQEGDSTYVSVGSSWQLVSVSLSSTVNHKSMRAQIYLHTAGTTINFDGATFASSNQAEA